MAVTLTLCIAISVQLFLYRLASCLEPCGVVPPVSHQGKCDDGIVLRYNSPIERLVQSPCDRAQAAYLCSQGIFVTRDLFRKDSYPLCLPWTCMPTGWLRGCAIVDDVAYVGQNHVALAIMGDVFIYDSDAQQFFKSHGTEGEVRRLHATFCCQGRGHQHNVACYKGHSMIIGYQTNAKPFYPRDKETWMQIWGNATGLNQHDSMEECIDKARAAKKTTSHEHRHHKRQTSHNVITIYVSVNDGNSFDEMPIFGVTNGTVYNLVSVDSHMMAVMINSGEPPHTHQLLVESAEEIFPPEDNITEVQFRYLHVSVGSHSHDVGTSDHDAHGMGPSHGNMTMGDSGGDKTMGESHADNDDTHDHDTCNSSMTFTVYSHAAVGFIQMESMFGSFLAWNNVQLNYSPTRGNHFLQVDIYDNVSVRHSNDAYLGRGKFYTQVISNKQGDFALLTNDHYIVYGREGLAAIMAEAVVLKDSNRKKDFVLAWDRNEMLVLLHMDYTENVLKSRMEHFDVNTEVETSYSVLPECACQALHTSMHHRTYYLDRNNNITLFVTAVPLAWKECKVMVSVSNPGIKAFAEVVEEKLVDTGVLSKELAITLREQRVEKCDDNPCRSYANKADISHVRLNPYPTSLRCAANQQRVAHVKVGCPPNKFVRIKDAEPAMTCVWKYSNHQFTIEPEMYDENYGLESTGNKNQPKTIEYNISHWACPIMVSYEKPIFEPKLVLYEDGLEMGPVPVDYVLWEIHGRKFHYSKLIADSICTQGRKPQTWRQMLLLYRNKTRKINPEKAWNSNNYKSCHNSPNVATGCRDEKSKTKKPDGEGGSDHYEIFNDEIHNEIEFIPENGIYVFEAIIVDPDYSYCDLRTRFAVEVFGKRKEPPFKQGQITAYLISVFLVSLVIAFTILECKAQSKYQRRKLLREMAGAEKQQQ